MGGIALKDSRSRIDIVGVSKFEVCWRRLGSFGKWEVWDL